jgi:hypothetical protein
MLDELRASVLNPSQQAPPFRLRVDSVRRPTCLACRSGRRASQLHFRPPAKIAATGTIPAVGSGGSLGQTGEGESCPDERVLNTTDRVTTGYTAW